MRLRIGLVCPYSFDRPGGVQNHVLGLAHHLQQVGHQASVLAPGDLPRQTSLTPEQFTTAGSTVAVPYNGSVARVNFGLLSAARVRRWLRAGDFDLLHIHEPITPSISLLALWNADGPVVATFHTATPRSRTMQLAGSTLRSSIAKIDAGIAVSESARKVVVQHLGRDAEVIPNGFGYADFAPPPAARRERNGPPRLVFLGRIDEPRKGLDVLLAAEPAIRAQFPDLEVVIAGEGSRELPPGWTTLGVVGDREKAALLSSADIFVAPHRGRESFGIVLLEAMASGAAVLASDLPPFLHLLRDPAGRSQATRTLGELFPAGNADALADAVIRMLRRPDEPRTARAQQAARRYDWSVVGPQIIDVYQLAVAGRRPVAEFAG